MARSSCIAGLVDRPIFLALIAGFCTSDWTVALALGITLELLWLDVLELGSVVPPFSGLGFLLLFPLAAHFGWNQPGPLLLPLLLVMLAAYAESFMELRQRAAQNLLVDRVAVWCEGGGCGLSPGQAVVRATLYRAFRQFLLYAVCYSLIFSLLSVLRAWQATPLLPFLTWPMVFAASLLGAILSLRTRQAYAVLLISLGALALLLWARQDGLL